MTPREGADANTWVQLVRRAWLEPNCKLIALLLLSYASSDGTSIYPGSARLAVNSGLDWRTVQRHLRLLRSVGLIEAGSRKGIPRTYATPYRLTIPGPGDSALDFMTPADELAQVEAVRSRTRGKPRRLHDTGDLQSAGLHDKTRRLHDTGDTPPSISTRHEKQPSLIPNGDLDLTEGGRQTGNGQVKISSDERDRFLERLRQLGGTA